MTSSSHLLKVKRSGLVAIVCVANHSLKKGMHEFDERFFVIDCRKWRKVFSLPSPKPFGGSGRHVKFCSHICIARRIYMIIGEEKNERDKRVLCRV